MVITFTPNNFSVTGAGNDSVEDTPTNNFCTINFKMVKVLELFKIQKFKGADLQMEVWQ